MLVAYDVWYVVRKRPCKVLAMALIAHGRYTSELIPAYYP